MRSPASFSGAERNRALSARAPSTRRGVDGAAAAAFAEALHEAQPLVLAPTAHTWFDGSPLPKKTQFLFPSNRSSASTVAPNRSASPVDGVASTATREVESRAGEGGAGSSGTDTMRKEMIRLYDTNVELREQVERLQACLRREGAAQMAECKRRCCERCAELEAALRTEQSRSAEKDKAIAALREKLLEEGRSTTCLNTSRVGGADIVGGSLKDRLLADGHQLAPPAHHAAAHLVLQEEIAMLKTKLSQLGPNKSHASEQWKATQMSSQSQNDPVQSQTPHSRASDSRRGNPMELTERNVTHRAYDAWHPVAPEHGELKQGGPLSSHEEETGAAVSLWNRLPRTTLPSAMAATHTPQSTSSRAFTPQTLADLSEFAAKMPSKTVNQPWYNDDEVKEVVSSSRASRLRVSTSPRRLLQPSYVGTLSRGAQVGSRQRSWCNTSTSM
ncbi:hypothetical protein DQ04_02401050 [Trypanosoma grayi]|uniref:hypothetical protein n=1 Tax=Trypanosoma grayi TaxID=71804 RepID=UPI0004F44103|nr:hypothetical protein DQ04_02401050 [Trypanosoma grayi]KEG11651.1 hypothetical protein DQ04_02401050 [Trypanosoma grayi]